MTAVMLNGVSSLLLWFAVHDHVEDILEHLDTVQVSEETREGLTKYCCIQDIYLTYV